MATIIDTLKYKYKTGSMLIKLLFVNIGIFLLLRITSIIVMLSGGNPEIFLQWIEMPSQPELFLHRPWTIITYMFSHYDILHILFNMLWLYWFGQIFLIGLNTKQMFALYIYGGIGGALLYLLAYNTLPYFDGSVSFMLGASASIIAIVVATAVRYPNYRLNLLFIGQVSLKWIAIITIAIDFLSITGNNAGGHIAHIGGGIVGFIFASMLNQGKDITRPFNSFIDSIVNFAQNAKFPSLKKKVNPTKKEQHNNTSTANDHDSLNEILDKIKKSGYSALTPEERKQLFDISRRIK